MVVPPFHTSKWAFLVGKPMGLLGKPTISGNTHMFFHVKTRNNIQVTTKTGNTMNLSWFVGSFFLGKTWYKFWRAETYYVLLREYLQEKGHLWKEIQRNWSDRTWSWNCQIISGRIPMPTSGVMFAKNVGNFHRRRTLGIHMLGLVECWQIFHGSRPTVCSKKESHQKGTCNPLKPMLDLQTPYH